MTRINNMIKYFVLFIILLSNIALAEEPIKIELENKGNNFRVYFINLSEKSILLNKWITFGTFRSIEETIELIDNKGEKIPFSLLLDHCPFKEEDILSLTPGSIIGREFKPEELVKTHWITEPGLYKVRAIYNNRDRQYVGKGVFNGSLTSDWVSFEVTEKTMEQARGKDWRKIAQEALERKRQLLNQRNEE